jgi:hypothetical protein
MFSVQKHNICTNVPSSQTFGSYLNSQYTLESEGLLPCSQVPVVDPDPEPEESIIHPPFLFI